MISLLLHLEKINAALWRKKNGFGGFSLSEAAACHFLQIEWPPGNIDGLVTFQFNFLQNDEMIN
jgi:hypothetical protein